MVGEPIRFKPGSYLLVTEGDRGPKLRVDGEELVLP